MKLLISAFILSLSLGAHASSLIGEYKAQKEITVGTGTEEECRENKGGWIQEEEICIVNTQDSAEIKKISNTYKLVISTIGSNFHSCDFQAKAELVNETTLVAKIQTEEYDRRTDSSQPVECVVTAKLSSKDTLDISTNYLCQSFCGANAGLETANLKKVK